MSSKLLACALLLAAACTTASRSAPSSSDPDTETVAVETRPGAARDVIEPAGEVLGHIKLHSHKVTIRSSDRGLRFDIRTNAGEIVAMSLTQTDFATDYPALFDVFEEAYGQLDATLHDTAPPRELP